jgi:hypothetical protein
MRRFGYATVLSITTIGIASAGAVVDHSVVSILGKPGVGPCSSECTVGGLGQGGTSSDLRAQGSYRKGEGRLPGVNVRAAGTQASGRLELSGAVEGTLSGTFQGDAFRGHTTGPEFGTCSGSCSP